MVQAGLLPLGAEDGSRLRFDDGCEFVGGLIRPGAVGKVDKRAGRESVTAR